MAGETETLALHLVRALYDNLARCPSGWHEETPHSHCPKLAAMWNAG
jgi:hypothetical protein